MYVLIKHFDLPRKVRFEWHTCCVVSLITLIRLILNHFHNVLNNSNYIWVWNIYNPSKSLVTGSLATLFPCLNLIYKVSKLFSNTLSSGMKGCITSIIYKWHMSNSFASNSYEYKVHHEINSPKKLSHNTNF